MPVSAKRRAVAALTAIAALTVVAPAAADHSQPPLKPQPMADAYDRAVEKAHFRAGAQLPPPDDFDGVFGPLMDGLRFNPSGEYSAFDTNVFETLALPYRAAGDESDADEYGNGGDPRHGYCKADPENDRHGELARVAGSCPNHQLEYSKYFEATMRDILGDFGVKIHRYRFHNPGGDDTQSGRAINTAAVVAGADHPEDTVIVSGHFDQTNDGPASAWDSAEGHAQVIRMAKIMADYWRATGTRPSATVKFVPWDAEETGTLGSLDYVENNIVPGQEHLVRGYWNTDPCAGGYPAFRRGNRADRVDLGIQLVDPNSTDVPADEVTKERFSGFNARARVIVEEVFQYLDDDLQVGPQTVELFVSKSEEALPLKPSDIGTDVVIGDSKPLLFASDWRNFQKVGIPFFNPGPEITGPSNRFPDSSAGDLGLGYPDGLAILHTPNDNLQTLNAYTSLDQSGTTFSEGWIKGMEMCAQLLSWGMLQHDQGGAQVADERVVAYYEALPNEAVAGQGVTFDAGGSHQYRDAAKRRLVRDKHLRYDWDFGDGTSATGQVARHAYAEPGRYVSRLTVRGLGGSTDTVTVPVTVVKPATPGPALDVPAAEDGDGTIDLSWRFETTKEALAGFIVEEAQDLTLSLSDDASEAIEKRWTTTKTGRTMQHWRTSDGAPAPLGNRHRTGPSSYWAGQLDSRQLSGGSATMTTTQPVTVPDHSDAALSYWSLFRNEPDERGLVEVVPYTGTPPREDDWKVVDSVGREFIGIDSFPEALEEGFHARTADLSAYRGRQILLRFRFQTGGFIYPGAGPNSGWYVDDIKLLAGTFVQAETTTAGVTSTQLTGRTPGAYAYRVKARFDDGLVTLGGNVETVRVTGG